MPIPLEVPEKLNSLLNKAGWSAKFEEHTNSLTQRIVFQASDTTGQKRPSFQRELPQTFFIRGYVLASFYRLLHSEFSIPEDPMTDISMDFHWAGGWRFSPDGHIWIKNNPINPDETIFVNRNARRPNDIFVFTKINGERTSEFRCNAFPSWLAFIELFEDSGWLLNFDSPKE